MNFSASYARRRSSGWAMLQKWGVVLFGLGAAQGAIALAIIILARRVTQLEYGQYLACYGLTSLLVVLPNLGLESWLLASGSLTPDEIARRWQNAFRLRLIALGAWLITLLVGSFWLPQETYPLEILFPTAAGTVFDSLTLLSNAAWRVLERHGRVTTIQSSGALILLSATLLAPIAPGRLFVFAWLRLLISAAIFFANLRLSPRVFYQAAAPVDFPHLVKASSSFTVAEIATSIYLKADLTIVALFLGAAGSSIYGPALNFTNLCFLISQGLYLAALPKLGRDFLTAKPKFIQFGAAHLLAQALAGGLAAAVVFGLATFIVQVVYGSGYEAAGAALRWMSPLIFIKGLNFGLGALLSVSGNQAKRSGVQVLAALFNISANLLIVIPLGIPGVIAVYLLSEALLFAGYLLYTLQRIFLPYRSQVYGS